MNRRKFLIGVIAGLSVALAGVLVAIVIRTATPAPVAAHQPPPAETARFVGTSSDGRFAVAVVVWNTQAIGYLSAGPGTDVFMKGVVQGDQVQLAGAPGVAMQAMIVDGSLRGLATTGRKGIGFALPLAQPPAGAYLALGTTNGTPVRLGLIVLPDGRQVGSAPAWDQRSATVDYNGTPLTVRAITLQDV
jgi:hypothetical protein